MPLKGFRDSLLSGGAEKDPAFRKEIQALAIRGLKIAGAVEIGTALFFLTARTLVRIFWQSGPPVQRISYAQTVGMLVLGGLTLLAARFGWAQRRPRLAGAISGWLMAALLIWSWLLLVPTFPGALHYIPAGITVVLLVAVAALPLRPGHTFALGISIEGFALGSWLAAVRLGLIEYGQFDAVVHLYDLMVILLCTFLTALMHAERRSEHDAHRKAVLAVEQLVRAQTRAALAESTASLGRLASGLLHELNSPIGALSSGLKTLIILAHKLPGTSGEGRERLLQLQAELHTTLLESAGRLEQIVNRVRKISRMDEAELQPANLNELVAGISGMFSDRARQRGVEIQMDLQPLPPVVCRPQQISAALNVLFDNAMQAVGDGGHIRVSSSPTDSHIEVRLEDDGCGIPPEKLESIFNPTFTVAEGRVEARNWGLFTARQIVLGHGGEIEVRSQAEQGTTVTVRLPV